MNQPFANYELVVDTFCKVVLDDSCAKVRARAAAFLAKFTNPRVVQTLLRALQDPSADVRMAAAKSLGKIGNEADHLNAI